MTNFGKVLVYLNTFVAVVLFGWALSLYTQRLDYFDRTEGDTKIDGQLTQLNAEVKRFNELIKGSQMAYAATSDRLKLNEVIRDARKDNLDRYIRRIRNVDDVTFKSFIRINEGRSALLQFPEKPGPDGLLEPEGQPVPGMEGPLKGLGALNKQYRELCQRRLDLQALISKHLADYEAASKLIAIAQDEVIRHKVLYDNLKDEQDFLNDAKINWEEQLRILEQRQNQLKVRLEALGAAPPAGK